jgi:hypothetical protein
VITIASIFEDERVKNLFLIKSPWPVLAIIAAYLFFVTGRGQKWMQQRKAFELNSIINIYNIAQIFLNLYLGFGVIEKLFSLCVVLMSGSKTETFIISSCCFHFFKPQTSTFSAYLRLGMIFHRFN